MSSLKANQTLANNDTLPVYRSVARKWLLRYWLLLTIILIIILGLIVYWPILEFTFFWEDPYDVGQVEEHSYIDLFLVSTNGLYYRPLHLALVKLLKLGLSQFIPYPFFIFNLIARIVGSLLLFGFARRLTNSVLAAFGAALIFLFTPIPFDSTAKAMSAHQALLLPYITALWLYLEGRLKERPLLLGLSIAMVIISLLVHESAILLPLIILSLELYLYRQRYVTRFARVSLIYLVPVGFFVIVWFAIPKNQSLLAFDHGLEKALYLSQSLSFPFAWLISRIGGLGLEPWGQATIAIALTLALIVTMYRRKHWPKMLLWIFWWLITSSLLWLTLSFDYLQTGSRLLYLPSLMAALIWGGILLNGKSLRSHLSKLLVLLILLQSLVAVSSLNSLYGNGSTLMKAVLDAGKKHKKILFINLPDRFEYRQPLYPLGFWGMMLAPVSQQLADFVWLNTSNETQTLSLSNFPLADSMFMVSPYQVHTRGSDSYGSKLLYDSLIWADESYWVSYKPNGEIMMEPIGNIMQSSSKKNAQSIASFGQIVNLLSANIRMEKGNLYFETTFLVDYSAAEGVAIFVHIVDASGQILAQADGDSLGGMIPSQAWRKGNTVTDIRTIPLNQITDINSVQLLFGFYNRWDGTRLPAVSSTDLEIQNDAVSIPIP